MKLQFIDTLKIKKENNQKNGYKECYELGGEFMDITDKNNNCW